MGGGWDWGSKRAVAALISAGLLIGFGGGFWADRALSSGHPHAVTASTSGFEWPFFGKPRAANAPRGGPRKPDGFAIWKTRVETAGADPISCVTMSRDLDPRKSYSDFVLVSPDLGHPVAASVHGDELCVAGLGFAGHRLTLLKGLPAKSGETLADNVDVDFAGADQPPYVGFDGGGVILPREESDGVGIDTVNVSRLHVEVLRVADRNLVRKSITAPDPTPEGEYSYEGEDDDDARTIWKGDVAVSATGGQRAVTVFPLGAVLKDMKPGAN
jgi:alpha-2-macroglobulin